MNLYLIRGLPGSGKSTFAKMLAWSLKAGHFEADQYFMDESGDYTWIPELVGRAHYWCQRMTEESMKDVGCPVVVSNTFTTEKELKPYLELAEQYGYTVTVMIIENRHGSSSVHGVPEGTMTKMRNRFSVKL